MVEKINMPGGAIQTFEPRPRPATWVVAETVNPLGSFGMSFGFLVYVRVKSSMSHRADVLLQHGVCASYHFSVHEQITPCLGRWLDLSIALQTREEQTMVEEWCKLGMGKSLFMRDDLLGDLGVVNTAIFRNTGFVCIGQRLLKTFKTPDCVFILDVEVVRLCSDPLLAILFVDDVAPVG